MRGPLAAEFYYVYAMDERGGEWKGKAFMCTTIASSRSTAAQDCFVRGYDRTGFFEVDTGKDAKNWTVQLTDPPTLKPRARRVCAEAGARRRRSYAPIVEECHCKTAPPHQDPRHARAGLRRPRGRRGAVRAGADVFRINMSHASHDAMRERVAMIRSLEEKVGRPIGILVDLQGPKLRVGVFAERRRDLRKGDVFTLDDDPTPGDATRVYLPHPEILRSLAPGHRRADRRRQGACCASQRVRARPRRMPSSRSRARSPTRRASACPTRRIPTSAMTEKDRADLDAALDENIDWIALSFVQRPEDVVEVKRIAAAARCVMAKIEKPQAIAAPRRDHRRLRRAHGGARRSRRRNAARARARPAEDASPGSRARSASRSSWRRRCWNR